MTSPLLELKAVQYVFKTTCKWNSETSLLCKHVANSKNTVKSTARDAEYTAIAFIMLGRHGCIVMKFVGIVCGLFQLHNEAFHSNRELVESLY